MARTWLALGMAFASVLLLGCETQRIETLETRQRHLDQRLLRADSQLAEAEKEISRIDEKLALVDKLSNLAANLEAVKAYFKDVSDRMRAMRHDVVTALDEQNARIEEGRREYVKVLQRQQVMLAYMQQEIERALKELEKAPPDAGKAVSEEAPQPTLSP